MVPLAAGIGLGFAILSYAGKDLDHRDCGRELGPRRRPLPAALRAAADELACHLGVRTEPTVAPTARPRGALHGRRSDDPRYVAPRRTRLLTVCWATMRERRIRHLPVVDRHGVLCGLISHRDLLAASPSSLSLQTEADRIRILGWTSAADVMETHVSTAAVAAEPAAGRGSPHGAAEDRLFAGGRPARRAGRYRDRGRFRALVR